MMVTPAHACCLCVHPYISTFAISHYVQSHVCLFVFICVVIVSCLSYQYCLLSVPSSSAYTYIARILLSCLRSSTREHLKFENRSFFQPSQEVQCSSVQAHFARDECRTFCCMLGRYVPMLHYAVLCRTILYYTKTKIY